MDHKTLFEKINSCAGTKYQQLLLSHQTSQAIFAGNYRDLKGVLDFVHNPAKSISLFNVENRNGLQAVQHDIIRFFHNYVSSALTLVEHTRILMRDDAVKQTYQQEYQEKVNGTFVNDELAGFVQDLRNYLLHRGIPNTCMQLSWTRESQKIDTRVFLDVQNMRDWDGWHSRSKSYLSKVDDNLALLEIIEAYTGKVRDFHEWFASWFMCLHTVELDALRVLQEQWNKGIEVANKGAEATADPLRGPSEPQP